MKILETSKSEMGVKEKVGLIYLSECAQILKICVRAKDAFNSL